MARIVSPKLNEFLIDFFHQFDDASHLQLDDFISRTPGLQAPENAVRFHTEILLRGALRGNFLQNFESIVIEFYRIYPGRRSVHCL